MRVTGRGIIRDEEGEDGSRLSRISGWGFFSFFWDLAVGGWGESVYAGKVVFLVWCGGLWFI